MIKNVQHQNISFEWYSLIEEAESRRPQFKIDQDLKAYLMIALQRFTRNPGLLDSIIATEYLNALSLTGEEKKNILRDVGDKCLLLSGLFPEVAERRNLSLLYYVNMGHNSYTTLSELHKTRSKSQLLFEALGNNFIRLMNLLQAIKSQPHPKNTK